MELTEDTEGTEDTKDTEDMKGESPAGETKETNSEIDPQFSKQPDHQEIIQNNVRARILAATQRNIDAEIKKLEKILATPIPDSATAPIKEMFENQFAQARAELAMLTLTHSDYNVGDVVIPGLKS